MGAKDSLLATLAVLKDCLSDQALIDKAPGDVAHNLRASMLRQGLAVLTFSAVESFIRERTGEILQTFNKRKLTFSDLSSALQKALTLGALEGVRFRLKLQPPQDRIAWLVAKLAPIASATSDVSRLSDHSFAHAASNLDEDEVRDILKAFGVDAPWAQITHLTSRLGVALLNSEGEFEAIKKRRHASAHALTTTVLYADLLNSLRSALAICLAFDLLLSHSTGMHNRGQAPNQASRAALSHIDIRLVFVAPMPGTQSFRLRKEQLPPPSPVLARPTIRILANEAEASAHGARYARRSRSQLVILDHMSIPSGWVTS